MPKQISAHHAHERGGCHSYQEKLLFSRWRPLLKLCRPGMECIHHHLLMELDHLDSPWVQNLLG